MCGQHTPRQGQKLRGATLAAKRRGASLCHEPWLRNSLVHDIFLKHRGNKEMRHTPSSSGLPEEISPLLQPTLALPRPGQGDQGQGRPFPEYALPRVCPSLPSPPHSRPTASEVRGSPGHSEIGWAHLWGRGSVCGTGVSSDQCAQGRTGAGLQRG